MLCDVPSEFLQHALPYSCVSVGLGQSHKVPQSIRPVPPGWLRSTVGRTPVFGRWTDPVLRSACSRRATIMWVNRPLQVSQLGQLSLSSCRGRQMSSRPVYRTCAWWCHLVNAYGVISITRLIAAA